MPKHNKNDCAKLDVKPEVLDELLKGAKTPSEINALFKGLKKAILERALNAELTHHLGYAKGEEKPEGEDNHRNGTTPKTVITDEGALPLSIPRDRSGTFAPLTCRPT